MGLYAVDTILDKLVVSGEVYYFLRWAGYDESHDSWEPAKKNYGLDLLPEFERQWNEKQKNNDNGGGTRQRRKPMTEVTVDRAIPSPLAATFGGSTSQNDNGNDAETVENEVKSKSESKDGSKKIEKFQERQEMEKKDSSEMNGFDKGLQPEKIIGAIKSRGVIYFLIKWKNEADTVMLVTNEVAKEKCPELLFQFYEERLNWPECVKDKE